VRQTKEAVEALRTINPSILVEGEIGDIEVGSEIHQEAPDLTKGLTNAEAAKQFVESTGIGILAPVVGNIAAVFGSIPGPTTPSFETRLLKVVFVLAAESTVNTCGLTDG
jgi:fructose/tagatose bisphosphate aldolase